MGMAERPGRGFEASAFPCSAPCPAPPRSQCGWLAEPCGGRWHDTSGPRHSMIERLRLPRLQIATKLYGAIALILAVVYVLAAAATQFASRTEETTRRFQEDGYS